MSVRAQSRTNKYLIINKLNKYVNGNVPKLRKRTIKYLKINKFKKHINGLDFVEELNKIVSRSFINLEIREFVADFKKIQNKKCNYFPT